MNNIDKQFYGLGGRLVTLFGVFFDWLHITLIITLIIFLFFLFLIIGRTSSKLSNYLATLEGQHREKAKDQFDLLHTFARETANELIARDEKNFSQNFQVLYNEWEQIKIKRIRKMFCYLISGTSIL